MRWGSEKGEKEEPLETFEPRNLICCLTVAVAYYCASRFGFALTFSTHTISVMWLPNALLLGSLLLQPPRKWWLLFVLCCAAHLAVQLQNHVPFWMSICWFISNSAEAVIGAVVTMALVGSMVQLRTLREVLIFFVWGVLFAVLVSSFLDAWFVGLNQFGQQPFWHVWRMRVFSNACASMVLVPMILSWATAEPPPPRRFSINRLIEAFLLTLGTALTAGAVFCFQKTGKVDSVPLLYSPVPFLLWAAARFGLRGTSTAIFAVAILAIWGAAHDRGPFPTNSTPEDNALAVQILLISLCLTLIPLATSLTERRLASRALMKSAQEYREVVESQKELVCRFLTDTTLTFVNQAFCGVMKQTREALIGRKLLQFTDAGAQEAFLLNIAKLVLHKNRISWNQDINLSQGQKLALLWTAYPVYDSEGHVVEVQAIGNDITERRRMEEELRDSEERYREVVESQPDLVSRFLPDTTLTFVNQAATSFFGASLEELIGRKLLDLLPEDMRRQFVADLDSVLNRGGPVTREYVISLREGVQWYHWTVYAIRDARGAVKEIQAIARDISEHKEIESAREKIFHANRLATMGELTALIAHQVSQPLNAILHNLEAVAKLAASRPASQPETDLVLADLRNDALRATQTLRQLRAFSKKQKMQTTALNLNSLIETVILIIHADASLRRITIRSVLAPDLPGVSGDPILLQQVLLNIILNAMDSLAEVPERDRRLELRTQHHNHRVIFSASDNGKGIATGSLPRVFESFFSTKPEGVGMGLSIARSIIQAHNGQIWAENNQQHGATVHFLLPATADDSVCAREPASLGPLSGDR